MSPIITLPWEIQESVAHAAGNETRDLISPHAKMSLSRMHCLKTIRLTFDITFGPKTQDSSAKTEAW